MAAVHKILGVVFLTSLLTGCNDDPVVVPYKDPPSFNARNPVGVFCRPDCSGCDFNVNHCKKLVSANLPSLCDNTEDSNCYSLLMTYTQTCDYLCQPTTSAAKGGGNLVNVMFTEEISL